MTDDARELHRRSLTVADGFVSRVEPADLDRSTPCAGWRLADLLAHMIGQHLGFAEAVRTGSAPAAAYAPVPYGDARWQTSLADLVDAFAAAELARPVLAVELAPDPLPTARIVGAQLLDTVVHTWDIARSLGADFTPDRETLEATARIAAALPEQARGPGRAFAAAGPPSDDPWSDTLALVGRAVTDGA